MSKSIEEKINKCIEIAKCLKNQKETGRSFHCTFIFDKGKLLSIGCNNYNKLHKRHVFGIYRGTKDNPERYIASIHSEIDAISRLKNFDFNKYTFINIRIDKNNKVNIAKPCENCLSVLMKYGFKRILYTVDDLSYGCIFSNSSKEQKDKKINIALPT